MTRIFEDILDDIDIEEESNVVTDLANSSNDAVDVSQYDYVLDVCFNVYDVLDRASMTKIERIEEDSYDEVIVPLKKKFDVYLDSYWTDDVIYVVDDRSRLDSWNKADLLNQNKMFLNVYYKVYLNFDGNLNHLISFIYSATNPNPQMSYALYDMYYSNLFKNDDIQEPEIFDYIESQNLSQKYINDQTYLYTFHGLAIKIYEIFYNQNRVLKFPENLSPKECIDKIEDKLVAFAARERKRNIYNK